MSSDGSPVEGPTDRSGGSDAHPGSVLVVHGRKDARDGHVAALRAVGCEAMTAADGAGAIAHLDRGGLDAVVCAATLPDIDPLRLIREVRERDLDLPVIVVAETSDPKAAARALEYGALRYLVEPVDPAELGRLSAFAVRIYRASRIKRQALDLLGVEGQRVADRAGLETTFESALRSLWMAYQPIVCWSRRAVFGYEALVRAREPVLSRPDELFDAAERLGRLSDLGGRIRALVSSNSTQVPQEIFLFVNLHPMELQNGTLFDADAPLSRIASRVVLEVTERASLDGVPDLRERIASLKALGFRIAVDDLGAGFAGLGSLTALEPALVKLDMSLIRDVHKEPAKRTLIRSTLNLCRDLGVLVVAEGIETVEERDAVVGFGCDLLQGYLFARPGLPFPEVSW